MNEERFTKGWFPGDELNLNQATRRRLRAATDLSDLDLAALLQDCLEDKRAGRLRKSPGAWLWGTIKRVRVDRLRGHGGNS